MDYNNERQTAFKAMAMILFLLHRIPCGSKKKFTPRKLLIILKIIYMQ